MRLAFGGTLAILAPERGEPWAADLSVIAAEGQRPSAAVYLTASECRHLAKWLSTMADAEMIRTSTASGASARPSQFEGALPESPKDAGGAVSREGET